MTKIQITKTYELKEKTYQSRKLKIVLVIGLLEIIIYLRFGA